MTSNLYILSLFIITATVRGGCYCYPYCADEKTGLVRHLPGPLPRASHPHTTAQGRGTTQRFPVFLVCLLDLINFKAAENVKECYSEHLNSLDLHSLAFLLPFSLALSLLVKSNLKTSQFFYVSFSNF